MADRHEVKTGDDPNVLVELMQKVASLGPVIHAVVGVPGRVDYSTGVLEYAPNLSSVWSATLREDVLGRAVGVPVAVGRCARHAQVRTADVGSEDVGQGSYPGTTLSCSPVLSVDSAGRRSIACSA